MSTQHTPGVCYTGVCYTPDEGFRIRLFEAANLSTLGFTRKMEAEKLLFRDSFRLLCDHLLEGLLEACYSFDSFRLELSREYPQYNYQLVFQRGHNGSSLILDDGRRVDENEDRYIRSLKEWFNNLAQQNAGQLRLLN